MATPPEQIVQSRFAKFYLRATKHVPGGLGARLDLVHPSLSRTWLSAMNGQEQRQALVRQILANVSFDEIVETGTYRAETTRFLNHASGLPVRTVESHPRYFRYSKMQCAKYPKIDLNLGDSRDFLSQLASRPKPCTTYFYLDAHWETDVPRKSELEIIHDHWVNAVVMIDDFAVPHDPHYGFTYYGGTPLDLHYLPALDGWSMFYPSTPSAEETGAKRGCLVLATPSMTINIKPLPLLTPA